MKKNIILTAFSLLLLYGCTGDMERIQTRGQAAAETGGNQQFPHRVNTGQTIKPRQPGANHKGA